MRWLLILVFLATLGVACGSSSDPDSETKSNPEVNMADEETITTASGLQIKTIVAGTGEFSGIAGTFIEIGTLKGYAPQGAMDMSMELRLNYGLD